jgi:hypothetical protein
MYIHPAWQGNCNIIKYKIVIFINWIHHFICMFLKHKYIYSLDWNMWWNVLIYFMYEKFSVMNMKCC